MIPPAEILARIAYLSQAHAWDVVMRMDRHGFCIARGHTAPDGSLHPEAEALLQEARRQAVPALETDPLGAAALFSPRAGLLVQDAPPSGRPAPRILERTPWTPPPPDGVLLLLPAGASGHHRLHLVERLRRSAPGRVVADVLPWPHAHVAGVLVATASRHALLCLSPDAGPLAEIALWAR